MLQSKVASVLRVLTGDDIFVSYSRADGATYAAGLASELSARGLWCRFDQWGSEPSKTVPESILNAVRRSSMLIVVATSAAGRSQAVEEEIKAFLPTSRLIIPIDLDGTVRQAEWWRLLDGLPPSPEKQGTDGRVATRPSSEVLDRIENSITFTRRNQRLRLGGGTTLIMLLALLVWGAVAAKRAGAARAEATRLNQANQETSRQLDATLSSLGEQKIKLDDQVHLTAEASAQRQVAENALTASKAEFEKQKELTDKAIQERAIADEQLRVSQTKLADQTAIAESREVARLAPARPSHRERIEEAVKALQLAETDAAKNALRSSLEQLVQGGGRNVPYDPIAVSADGKYIAVASSGYGGVFDLVTTGTKFELCGYPESIQELKFSPNGKYLVAVRPDGNSSIVQFWDVEHGTHTMTSIPSIGFATLWVSPDSSRVLTEFDDAAYLLDVASGHLVKKLGELRKGHPGVVFDPSHRTFLKYRDSDDNTSKAGIWDLDSGRRLWTQQSRLKFKYAAFRAPKELVVYGEKTKTPFFAGGSAGFEVYSLGNDGIPIGAPRTFSIENFDYRQLAGGPLDASKLAFGFDSVLGEHYLKAGSCRTPTWNAQAVLCHYYAFNDKTVRAPILFDIATDRTLGPPQNWKFEGEFSDDLFSPDGSLLVAAGWIPNPQGSFNPGSHDVSIWDVTTWQTLWTFPISYPQPKTQFSRDDQPLFAKDIVGNFTAFSRDGKRLFIGDKAFDSRSGSPVGTVPEAKILWVDSTGRHLIGSDGRAFWWDVDQGKELRQVNADDFRTYDKAVEALSSSASAHDLLSIAEFELHRCPAQR